MAESHSDADATCTEGGNISIAIIGRKVDVKTPDNQHINATTLDAVYTSCPLVKPLIEKAVIKGIGGERDEQEVRDIIKSESPHFLLHCRTDERFLEVLQDHESGKLKKCLRKELSNVGVKVGELVVEIKNLEEVNKTKEAINTRRYAKTSSNFEDDRMKKGIDEKAETIFYLYTNTSVKSASIKRCDEDRTTKMTKTKCPKDEIGYLWEARISSTSTADIQYYYTLERKHTSSTLIDTIFRRAEPRSTNYDSFHEKNYSCHFSERATICYSKWFFETVNKQNFNAYVTAIKSMNFNFQQLDSKVLKTFVSWIFEQETKDNIPKCLYLGALLALVDKNNAFDWQRKSDEHLCKRFADHFLDVLRTQEAIFLWNDVRKTLVNSLIRLAPKLVNASSFPRWISYVTSFYPYFGVKQILSESFTFKKSREYSQEKYVELVDWLTQHMTRDHAKDLQEKFLQILERIVFDAPDMDAVVALNGNSAFLNLFLKGKEQTEVFGKVFIKKAKDILIDNKGRLSKALTEIPKIPEQLQIQSIKAILLDFIELPSSDSSPRDKEKNSSDFCNEMSREDRLSLEEITSVIHALVKSNQPHCHDIFLHLLTSNFYEIWWEKLGKDQHVSILSKWIAVDLADHPNKASQCQPRDVFERAAELERLNIFSVGLIEEACFKGFERKNKDVNNFTLASMLEALATIEGLPPPLQDCYKKLFGSMLKKSSAVKEDIIYCSKKKSWFTNISPNSAQEISRLAESLLVQVLDWLQNIVKQGHNHEEFNELIDWSDFWVTMLSAEGSIQEIQKHKMFMSVKESLQALFSCLEGNEISVRVLKKAKKHKESLCDTFACLEIQTKNAKRKFKIDRKVCKERIEKNSKFVEEYEAKLKAVYSAISISKYVSKKVKIEISDIKEVNAVLEKCKSDEHFLSNLHSDDFWGILFLALKPSEALKDLWESTSFKRVAERCWIKEHDDSSEITLLDLLEFLTGICIETFRSEWDSFLTKPDDDGQTVQKLEDLVGHDVSEEKLEKEIAILVTYLDKKRISDKLKNDYLKSYAKRGQILRNVKTALSVLQILDLDSKPDYQAVQNILQSFTPQVEDKTTLSIKKNHAHVQKVQKYLTYNGDTESVLQQFHMSSDVVEFVNKTVNEDLHFMVEEVEEHEEQLRVTELLVTKLIDVHQFLGTIIEQARSSANVKQFFSSLDRLLKSEISLGVDIKQMIEYIEDCNVDISSLDGLYKSVANRVEVSKRVIANCLRKGKYSVHVNEKGDCIAKVNYDNTNGHNVEHFLPFLQNLRSRAYLIRNSAENKSNVANLRASIRKRNINYSDFITQVDLLTEICDLLTYVRSLEFLKYDVVKWDDLRGTSSLEDKRDGLYDDLEKWKSALSAGRSQYFFLNFYRSCQLRTLYQFFSDRSKVEHHDEALSLFKVVDLEMKLENVDEKLKDVANNYNNINGDSPEALVNGTGDALQTIFRDTAPPTRPLPLPAGTSSSIEYVVHDGEIFIVKLDEESPQTANVVLALYANTCKSFPKPHEILFCSAHTEWEEVDLLLNRCTFLPKQKLREQKSLHCIANVDLLQPEIRDKLVKRLKDQHSKNLLMLICRGKNCDHIYKEFNQYIHQICGMTDTALSACLEEQFANVVVYTSVLPGLGKTEKIKTDACQKGKNIITCSIYDSIDWNKLVARLKCLSIKSYHCLHFDIGQVDDSSLLDSFLFQLIVIGMVSSDTQLFHLPTSHVYIEIANTLQDSLRDSLQICKYFKSVRLNSFNYDDLVISSDASSNVQIVCQYLDAYRSESLEERDISNRDKDCQKPKDCHQLLSKYFSNNQDISFTILKTFLAFLAEQLRKFSESAYFRIASLQTMLGEKGRGIRTNLFKTLMDVSGEFSSRSIRTCSTQQNEAILSSKCSITEAMIKRVEEMVRWEDSNHLILVFNESDSQTATVIYRDKDNVPKNVKKLLTSQATRADRGNEEIADYSSMSTEELRAKLLIIASTDTTNTNHDNNLDSTYVVTPDNIHKMILIILRVRGRIPVILMGETGCGKTSLVRYLATTCKIPLSVFSLHAGIHEQQIVQFIEKKENDAMKEMWIFLDEINTTNHLGLISEIMCHHTLFGRPLSKKLVFLAACNPYKLRSEEQIKTAGLEHKSKSDESDENSRLVYRVHPLPEAMIDYVWDFGFLKEKDEMSYILRMVERPENKIEPNETKAKESLDLLAKLLGASQMFVRKVEANFSVSLRDVSRCITLIEWFKETLKSIHKYPISSEKEAAGLAEQRKISDACDPVIKSYILGLAHCYLYRLSTTELRNKYCEEMAKYLHVSCLIFKAVVRMMEENFLNRMDLPHGTCNNSSLRENVFVILVCILNRIPVFVVGKPGCSKSLSMRIIKNSLRGRDSTDDFFKTLPHVYVVSYQSSESSTSESIEKVFEKARRYARYNKDILPVVLLDEVGLAGCSKHNPLKVLHTLLDPESSTRETSGYQKPEVAVVGISNWALDAAKMNRAIHLSKPDPDVEDLHNTALSIMCDTRKSALDKNSRKEVRKLAESYHEYQRNQTYPNFHGLRDYYSLIRNLIYKTSTKRPMDINLALQRNFGGLPRSETIRIQGLFLNNKQDEIYPVTELIQQNLVDPFARHLMLFTNGDSAIDILSDTLSSTNKEVETIYGSRFDEDQSEEYNYRVLSRILFYMEQSCILILRDLELLYGALYDMLNQSYTIVDGKKMCRVAIGAHSNPACHIHNEFRCIVLKDDKTIDFSDPPFLNRFEKQLLRYSHVLSERESKTVADLSAWVEKISGIEGLYDAFGPSDMFIGFHGDTLSSLVFSHGKSSSDEDLFELCKADLMWVASSEGVVRAKKSDLFKKAEKEVQILTGEYFRKPIHRGLAHFITTIKEGNHSYLEGDEIGSKCFVMTYSGTRININCQYEVLSSFNSEKQLTKAVASFWKSETDLLILQCLETDASNLLLARSVIENERKSYAQGNTSVQKKHVIILIHVDRQHHHCPKPTWQFSFSGGWKQIFLDVLEDQKISLSQIHSASIQEMLHETIWPLKQIAAKVLWWCSSKFIANEKEQQDSTSHTIDNLFESEKVTHAVEELVNKWLLSNTTNISDGYLQTEIACNKEQLVNSSTFFSAVKKHVFDLVRVPLAKFIFFLESNNAWPPHLTWASGGKHDAQRQSDLESLWCELILNKEVFDMASTPDPPKYGSSISSKASNLYFPFSHFVITKIEDEVRQLFLDQLEMNDDDETSQNFETTISRLIPESVSTKLEDGINRSMFQEDVLDVFSAHFKKTLNREQRVSLLTASLALHIDHNQEQLRPTSAFTFQLLANVWKNNQKLLDQLQMITTCLKFVDENVLSRTISEVSSLNNLANKDEEVEESEANSEIENPEVDSLNSEENEDKFETALFANWSNALLPNQDSVETRNNGLESWIANARIFLLFARRMQSSANSVHFLRFCVDFARIILLPSKIPNGVRYLYELGEIGKRHNYANKPNYLDSFEAFKDINNFILNIERNEKIESQVLELFNAQFFGRCIETNIDMTWIKQIIERVLQVLVEHEQKTAAVMIPVILSILHCEKDEICEFLESSFSCQIQSRNLMVLNNALQELYSSHEAANDSYACTVICDIIESFLPPHIFEIDLKSGNSDIASIKLARKAVDILSRKSRCIDLKFLMAVAYLRGFLATFSEAVSKEPDLLVEEISIESPLAEINSIFKMKIVDKQEQSPLLIFFLKQLLSKMNMLDLRKMCQSSKAIDCVIQCFSNETSEYSKAKFSFYTGKYTEAEDAYFELEQSSLTIIEKSSAFFDKCKRSTEHVLALMELLLDKFFLKRATRKLNDSEAKMAKWLSEQIMNLPESEAKMLLNALINEKFNDEFLQLSSESNVSNVQQALLILHIVCVTSIRDENSEPSLLFNCLTNQPDKKLDILFSSVIKLPFAFNKSVIFSCTCGLRICTGQSCSTCPNCDMELKPEGDEFSAQNDQQMHKTLNEEEVELTNFVRSTLRFLVYANFYAGMALGFTIEQEVETTLQVENINGIKHCLKQVQTELKLVASIVDMTETQVVCLMHLVVKRCISNMKAGDSKSWFKEFAIHATQALEEIYKHPRKFKKCMLIGANQSVDGVEYQILELDGQAQEPKMQAGNRRLKRLLRMKKIPSLEGLRLYFQMSTKECRAKNIFLSLFFAKLDILRKIGHLHHILEWTRYVYSILNHRISRKDAKAKTIDDFLKGGMNIGLTRTDEEKKRCKQLFNNFKKAWQDVRKDVNGINGVLVKDMPNLNEHALPLAYCIIDENDEYGKYLYMAIKYLSSAQNEIIDQLLWISASQDEHALSFLHINTSYTAVQQVSLQVARKEDIISFQWQDELHSLPYAYNNLDYGMGEVVYYDVERIAVRLAESIAFGKRYLDFKLDNFIFSNEFFDSCSELLTEIKKLMPQSRCLPEEMEKNPFKNQKTEKCRELLAHLEMLMFLFTRVRSGENDMPLMSFVEKWKKMLPSPFPESSLPEPRESIKLRHVVALCEELECFLADGAIEGLPDDFRNEPLTEDLKNELQILFDSLEKHGIPLHIFHKILRRFVFRYYSSPNFMPEKTLRACLVNDSLWTSVEVMPSAEIYPNEITLEYLYATIAFIDEKVKPKDEEKSIKRKAVFGGRTGKRRSVANIY